MQSNIQRFVSSIGNMDIILHDVQLIVNFRCLSYFGPKQYISKPKLTSFSPLGAIHRLHLHEEGTLLFHQIEP